MRRALAALVLVLAWAGPARAQPHNFTALWWNAAEPGWGINITHQGDLLFGTLFTYDANREPLWLVMSDGHLQPPTNADPAAGVADLGTYVGALYRTTGPAFNATPFTPIGAGNITRVGDMRIAFGSRITTLDYDVGGVRVQKTIARQVYGTSPAACTASLGSRAAFTNVQDLWWNPAESGWGLNLTHQDDVIFGTLFTYRLDGRAAWYVMSDARRQADGSYRGDLYRTRGSPFDAVPFLPLDPASVTRVGDMVLRFGNGENGTLTYAVEGVSVTKAITRQVFAASQSVCTSPAAPGAPYANPTAYSTAATASLATAPEGTASTRRRITLNGVPIDYVATLGHLNTAGAEKASMFYAAYVREGMDARTRPITFIYNGGPGNSTLVLHLGSFGPKRLVTGVPTMTLPAPFALVDNAQSLLDATDLVFIDAVATGYSQALAPASNATFLSVDTDAQVFSDFVARYVAINDRRASPKYLMGESYGGVRAAVMARMLQASGIRLAGVVLVSPILDYNANCSVAPAPCTGHIASYAAAASYHGLAAAVSHDEMRAFARTEYAPAAQAFLAGGTPAPASVLDRLAATTGLARSAWAMNPVRAEGYFRTNLQAGVTFGRYDARVRLPSSQIGGGDPSQAPLEESFGVRIGEYLASLGYTSPVAYAPRGGGNFSLVHAGQPRPDVVPDLAATLDANPGMKVLALTGYYDLATPFLNTEMDLARLGARPTVRVRNYNGGHMMYLDDVALVQQKADLVQFYTQP